MPMTVELAVRNLRNELVRQKS